MARQADPARKLTQSVHAKLIAAGLNNDLRYHVSEDSTGESPSGMGIWNRYPLSDTTKVPGFGFALVTARFTLPSMVFKPTLVALHVSGPYPPRGRGCTASRNRRRCCAHFQQTRR